MTKLVLIARITKFINLIFEFSGNDMTLCRIILVSIFFLKKVCEKFGG